MPRGMRRVQRDPPALSPPEPGWEIAEGSGDVAEGHVLSPRQSPPEGEGLRLDAREGLVVNE